MRLVSWNVNGLRAVLNKGFDRIFQDLAADIFCLQETKLSAGILDKNYDGYSSYWNHAQKKGYSGTAVFTAPAPVSVTYGMGREEHDSEGRVITVEYPEFFLVNVYTPNSQTELARLDYRMEWDQVFRDYVVELDSQKPVVICGDLNVAHEEIDIKNPKGNHQNPGFTDRERNSFGLLLEAGFVDTFRHLHPADQIFSWWSYRFRSRERNAGWRIDYFLISERLLPQLRSAQIHTEIMGSDHCPVSIEMDFGVQG